MGGDQVVKLSDRIAAQFSCGVCASEAAMQEFSYNTVVQGPRHNALVSCVLGTCRF